MDAIEKRARELLAEVIHELPLRDAVAKRNVIDQLMLGGFDFVSIRALVAALTPPEGYVLVPVALVKAVQDLSLIYEAGGDIDSKLSEVEAMLAAPPEVKP